MRAFHSASSLQHAPPTFFRRGAVIAHPETPDRYTALRDALLASAHTLEPAGDAGLEPILAVHDAGYVAFLRSAWERRAEVDAQADELMTTQFARQQMRRGSTHLANQIGLYTADTSTPIREDTWPAAYGAAQAAVAAADAALVDGRAYALCRPPGHHAYADSAGGFCFLNNSAVAARRMLEATGGPVAVLDVDVHHGNGTQGVFYESGDVLTVSIHADPANYFPLYAGYADETGAGDGAGANLNLPLAHGAGDDEVMRALSQALERIDAFQPRALVVALGLDAGADDPLGVFNVTTDGFARMAAAVAAHAWPTALIQEGGYLTPALPRNLLAFLDAFDAAGS